MISPIDRLHLKSVKLAMVRKLTSTTKGSAQSGFGKNQVLEDRAITREITLFYQSSRNPHHYLFLPKHESPSKPGRLETKDPQKNTFSS